MASQTEKIELENDDVSTFRVVAKRDGDKDPFTANIPVKEDTFSLVLPTGYVNWPQGKPYPDPIRVPIDEEKNLWLNFGVSSKHGFYASLKVSKNGEK